MTPDQISTIRDLRGFGIAWPVIAKQLGATVAECREAIGLPTFDNPAARPALPWDPQQRELFDQ